MLGTFNTAEKDITVIGGGIAGLLAAWSLDQAGWTVTFLEKEYRCGGLINTTRTELGLAEWAAHSLLASDAVKTLFDELGLTLTPLNKSSKSRFIYRGGRMRKMPLKTGALLGTVVKAFSVKAPEKGTFETVEDWCLYHLGQPASDLLLTPFLYGIYGASPSEISLQAAFPNLEIEEGEKLGPALLARKRASKKRSRAGMMVPEKGMQSLTDALALRLRENLGERFMIGSAVTEIPDSPNVMICTQADAAASLIDSADPGLASALRELPYTPLVSSTVFVRRTDFSRPPRGVGVLVPAIENRDCLGILFPSSSFEGRTISDDIMSFTVMLGGTANPDVINMSDGEISGIIAKEMRDILGLKGPIQNIKTFRHRKAIPLYSPKILDLWGQAKEGWCSEPGRLLFGNYTGQVSIRGMMELCRSAIPD